MIKNNKILAIIPARGGSKGVPRKNIKLLKGKPLIEYTIEAALKSRYIDRTIVSTDDEEIAEVSRKSGAEVPYLRPIDLAKDDTPTIDCVMDIINWLNNNEGEIPDYICLLQCTSPFRGEIHINEAVRLLFNKNEESLVSVCECSESPYWMKKIENDRLQSVLEVDETYTSRQMLPKLYKLNGAIYLISTKELVGNKSFINDNTIPYIMNTEDSLDIDEIIDFKFAEFLINEKSK